MNKFLTFLIVLFILFVASCRKIPAFSESTANDTIISEVEKNNDDSTLDSALNALPFDETQMGLNIVREEESKRYTEEVEREYEKMLKLLPDYKSLFVAEKVEWTKYHGAVSKVARCLDHGSSSTCYYADVMDQSKTLRKLSFQKLLRHLQGKEVKFGRTRFTSKMIDSAYNNFIESVNVDNDIYEFCEKSELDKYKNCLNEERDCWNAWMSYRSKVSSKLPTDIRAIYDGCTNMAMREKLRQVKNQNEALGVTGHEPLDCILPENCSDKALLEYPCFNVVWAHHCADLDWYPQFD